MKVVLSDVNFAVGPGPLDEGPGVRQAHVTLTLSNGMAIGVALPGGASSTVIAQRLRWLAGKIDEIGASVAESGSDE